MIEAGSYIGKYKVLKKLGEGGFGQTFLAEDPSVQRRVVLKLSHPGADKERIRAEAKVLANLGQHPHIVGVHDLVIDGQTVALALDYVDGISLEDLLHQKGALTISEALQVTRAVATALDYVHAQSIIHRDIKPANIIIPGGVDRPKFESVKLTDFGVFGQLQQADNGMVTQAGQVFGTLAYMSPEQARGEPQTIATDIYGLGLLLYVMLYNRAPFPDKGSIAAVLLKITKGQITFPTEINLPVDVKELMSECLRPEADQRPASARVVLKIVEGIKNSRFDLDPLNTYVGTKKYLSGHEEPTRPNESGSTSEAVTDVGPSLLDEQSTGAFPVEVDCEPQGLPKSFQLPPTQKGRSLKIWIALFLAPAIVIFVGLMVGPIFGQSDSMSAFLGVALGLFLLIAGYFLAKGIRTWLQGKKNKLQADADDILIDSNRRDLLSKSIALDVNQFLKQVSGLDERIMAQSMALMINEFHDAQNSNDRQAALMNAIQILEKLRARLAPWYVRHEKALAFLAGFVAMLSGLITMWINLAKFIK